GGHSDFQCKLLQAREKLSVMIIGKQAQLTLTPTHPLPSTPPHSNPSHPTNTILGKQAELTQQDSATAALQEELLLLQDESQLIAQQTSEIGDLETTCARTGQEIALVRQEVQAIVDAVGEQTLKLARSPLLDLSVQQLAEVEREIDAEVQAAGQQLLDRHAVEVGEINSCRAQIARGFPGQHDQELADDIQAKVRTYSRV
ncbi:hypothetical protein B484DRAFT_428253, partial [Ochromonadaceae sp. CCMP2298]